MTDDPVLARKVPTLLDVARHAGVSRATASLVLRGSGAISAGTRERVEASMAALGYVYNRGAARLRASRSHTIGVLLPNLTNPFFATLLAGVEDRVESAHLSVFLANCNEDVSRQALFVTRMREHGVDGLIVCPAAGTAPGLVEDLERQGMPLVQLLREVPGTRSDYAGVDFAALARDATRLLAALGHRRIAFVSGILDHSAHADRLAGFRAAMAEADLEDDLILHLPLSHADGRSLAPVLMRRENPPSAILCFNDVVALGLHRGLVDLGVRIGVDVSLVGIDNTAECDLVVPGLASHATQPFRVGGHAAELLLRRLHDPRAAIERRIEPSYFVARPSCGPAPDVA
ncbi:LacI family DNA-binding transcriptional regulator [Aureimonas mangrovi]|uniref:LacI family DNA-binding transcriptional regulator n=1 Tax=Aureimonas mangrovi TaxID=2758041 RepID=UPI001AEE4E87|nr:LacI family DNA-binding transcriptional regulator [Aureimonas mangrovi]